MSKQNVAGVPIFIADKEAAPSLKGGSILLLTN
jgi:hypothetical protein